MIINDIIDTENDHNVNKHIDKYVKAWGEEKKRHKTVYLKMYSVSEICLFVWSDLHSTEFPVL